MCTSLTIKTLNHHELFGRTMDFPTKTPWRLTFLPQHYPWQPITATTQFNSHFAILGGMRHINSHYLIGDGINTAGLCCAELYFPVEATYHEQLVVGKINLSPQDFTTWLLSENGSVAEVASKLEQIALIKTQWYDHDGIYPFHWLITDKTGTTAVIEPTGFNLALQNNPVNVLTNTPPLAKHIANLNRFLGLPGMEFNSRTVAAIKKHTGTLPQRKIPTDRFIKAALARWQNVPADVPAATIELFNLLDSVSIKKENDRHDYTHYEGIIDVNTRTYWFKGLATGKLTITTLTNATANYSTAHTFEMEE